MVVLLPSCGSRDVYNQYETFTDSNWHYDSVGRFIADIKDTSLNYNVFVNIRHTEDYPYQNLWLFVESTGADNHQRSDTLELEMADIYGKWKGAGSGSLFQLAMPFNIKQKFTTPGEYKFEIHHGMRDTVLVGIKNIGIRIEKVK
jgi:gliding motility-associated lipoprotein GldH